MGIVNPVNQTFLCVIQAFQKAQSKRGTCGYLGMTQYHLKQINLPCRSFESNQAMTQLSSPENYSIQLMTQAKNMLL